MRKSEKKRERHELLILNRQRGVLITDDIVEVIRRCVSGVLDFEDIELETQVSIIFVSNRGIKKYNMEYRNINKITDVLSFPMLEFDEDGGVVISAGDRDCESGRVIIGDIILSLEKCVQQADDYGHSFTREIGFLVVHSMYHLLGYDHIEQGENEILREKEEKVLSMLELVR